MNLGIGDTGRELTGKTCIVTGARGGIGQAIAVDLARRGADIWATSRTVDDRFIRILGEMSSRFGVKVREAHLDLANPSTITTLVQTTGAAKGNVDAIVANAGSAHGRLALMTPSRELRDILEVNLLGNIALIQAFARKMVARKGGSIVTIGSVLGLEPRRGTLAYGTSKAALAFATQVIAAEVGPYGVRANCVAPGLVDTQMMELMDEGARTELLEATPAERIAAPSEIASVVSFLVGDSSSYVNGQIIRVDGGRR